MAITAQQIIDRASRVLLDITAVKYNPTELMYWISDAQRQIVLLRPDANPTVGAPTLVASRVQFSLPSGALRLLNAIYNGTAAAPGDTISMIRRSDMDDSDRAWYQAAAADSIKHIVYDDRFPTIFWTYPRPSATAVTNGILLSYATAPAEITTAGTNIAVPESYQPAILEWVLYRALSKIGREMNDSAKGDPALAAQYHKAFFSSMRMRAGVDLTMSPNWASYPRNTNASPLTGALPQA